MSKRRGHGEGSIYQRKDGRWVAAILQPNGERRAYYGATRREVQDRLDGAKHDLHEGLPLPKGKQTTAEYLTSWIDGARSSLRPSTARRYEALVRVHAIPALGRLPLVRLAPQHLQQLYADRLAAGSATASVHQLHAVIHRALEQATRWSLVPRNVASLVQAPRISRAEMLTLSPEQVRTFLASVAGSRHEALYVLAATTGMRQGELLGLHWADVDLDRRSAAVRSTLYRHSEGYTFTAPKTARSRRQVALTQTAVAALRRHRARQIEERFRVGAAGRTDLDLVFTNEVGEPMRGTRVTHTFQAALARAGLPRLRFHDLRHTAASLLLGRGVHPKIASEMLGHATIAVTLDLYSHVTPTMQRGAADELDAVLGVRA